ncbi:hypothetical protein ACWEPA_34870 [Streptomyces filamentosus]
MIKNLMRGLVPLALVLSPLTAPTASAGVQLFPDALAELTEAAEVPGGHRESAFPHWDRGLDAADGCDTRIICTACRG